MEVPLIHAADRKTWRAWLKNNHLREKKVGLISYKRHTGKPALTHKESMEEAICFGWIDTTIKKLDEDRYLRYFCKRSKNSKWSLATLSYGKDLIKRKLMTPIGLQFYLEGKKKKAFDHHIPRNPDMPKMLRLELEKDKKALDNFNNFTPSYKRMYFRWILHAKLPITQMKRIKVVVQRAKDNKKSFA